MRPATPDTFRIVFEAHFPPPFNLILMEGDIRCVSLKSLDSSFRNAVPDFDVFVVVSRNDVEEMCAVLTVGPGRTERIGMEFRPRGTSGGLSRFYFADPYGLSMRSRMLSSLR